MPKRLRCNKLKRPKKTLPATRGQRHDRAAEEQEDPVRQQQKSGYAKRQRPPESVLLSHVAILLPDDVSKEHEDGGRSNGSTQLHLTDLSAPCPAPCPETAGVGGEVRWLRDFTTELDNIYGLPLDSSVSSSSPEGHLFKEQGVWIVPTTGTYLISVLVQDRGAPSSCADVSREEVEDMTQAVLQFDGTKLPLPVQDQSEDRILEWRFPPQGLCGPRMRDDPHQWLMNVIADRRYSNTNWLAVDAQHKRRLSNFQHYVTAEQKRRQRYGKQNFHFYRIGQMLDENFERNKQKLAEMEVQESERQKKLADERRAMASPAEFFGRVFHLRQGVRMRIGLVGSSTLQQKEHNTEHIVKVAAAMIGDLTNYTVSANGRELPFAATASGSNSFGCFKTAKRFHTGEQLLHHMNAKRYHLPQNQPSDRTVDSEASSPYQCHLCCKHFSSEAALKAHSKSKRHVKCALCDKRFLNEEDAQRHLKNKHERDQVYWQEGRRYLPWPDKAPAFCWPRPKFCCEKEKCGRQFMTTEQLAQHHKEGCTQLFHKKADMYRHFKHKHDLATYQQGLVARLQQQLSRIKHLMERQKFGSLRWAEKKERVEIKLARALGISIEEYRSSIADKPMVTEGSQMEKSPTSHSVINIVPPRAVWDRMQKIRTLHVSDARCGPHISLIEPFVMPQHYSEAARLLKEALSKFMPFEITLSEVHRLNHEKSTTLHLYPETTRSGVDTVMQEILKIFPQCSDLLSRGFYDARGKFHASSDLNFIPHFSLRKIPHTRKDLLYTVTEHYSNFFIENPVKFLFKEIYILNRIKGDPFEVCHVIPLGPPEVHTQPYFGPGSPGSFGTPEENTALGRSVLLGGIPQGLDESVVRSVFQLMDLDPQDVEVVKNPDGARRSCAVIELRTVDDTRRALDSFDVYVSTKREELAALGLQPSSLYIRHMPNMVFPGPPGDCCSMRNLKREDIDPPEEINALA